MLSEEFAKRGAEFAKLMALADVLEEAKEKACHELYEFIYSLPDNVDGDQNYVKWAINLPQMVLPQSENLMMWIIDVTLALLLRSSSSFRTVASQKMRELMTWLIRLPEPFQNEVGVVLSRLWHLNHEELDAVLRKEALLASLALMEGCLEDLIEEKRDLVDLIEVILAFARDARWCAELMVSHLSERLNGDEKKELKRLIEEATTPAVLTQPSSSFDTTASASDEQTVPNTPPVEGASSVGVVGEVGPRKRKVTPDGQAEQRGNHQVKRLTSGKIYVDKLHLTNCNVYITPEDGKTDVAERGDGKTEMAECDSHVEESAGSDLDE